MAVIHITNAIELQNIKDDMAGEYELDNNIDLTGFDWIPIGADQANAKFTGSFDGKGHKITNLTVTQTGFNHSYVAGLFGFIGNESGLVSIGKAVIKNLTIENVSLTGSYAKGGIAGYIISGVIENCHVKNITMIRDQSDLDDDQQSIGGIAGDCYGYDNDPTVIDGCTVDGFTVDYGDIDHYGSLEYCGGLLGDCNGHTTEGAFIVKNCSAINVDIQCDYYANTVGGLIGYSINSEIYECFAVGTMVFDCANSNVNTYSEVSGNAGLIAEIYSVTIHDCYSDVAIEINLSSDSSRVESLGGFVGLMNYSTVYNCYARGNLSVTLVEGSISFPAEVSNTVWLTGDSYIFPSGTSELTVVRCFGGGGGGGVDNDGEGGGGGGASVSTTNYPIDHSLTYPIQVGSYGTPGVDGGDTYFVSPTILMAKGGKAGFGRTGGAGGLASESIGDTKYSGGNGGSSSGTSAGGGGGGSSAGTTANGNNGSDNSGATGGSGGFIEFRYAGNGGNNGLVGQTATGIGCGGGGGGANANAGNGRIGAISATFSYTPRLSMGGFIGYTGYTNSIQNCFSVGTITAPGGIYSGGFIGHINYLGTTIDNCAWFTGSANYAIASGVLGDNVNLEDISAGTDEADNTKFYLTSHPVFAQE